MCDGLGAMGFNHVPVLDELLEIKERVYFCGYLRCYLSEGYVCGSRMVRLMKYAVVIPGRNEEKHIEATLSALRKQTVPPNQIIVVDDCSKDRALSFGNKRL